MFLCFPAFKMLIRLLCASLFNCYSVLGGVGGFFIIPLLLFRWCFRRDQKQHCIFSICSAWPEVSILYFIPPTLVLSSHFPQTSMTTFMMMTLDSSPTALIFPEFLSWCFNFLHQGSMLNEPQVPQVYLHQNRTYSTFPLRKTFHCLSSFITSHFNQLPNTMNSALMISGKFDFFLSIPIALP